MANYESPKIDFAAMQTNEKIADTCWGYFANGGPGVTLFYDSEGVGYVKVTYSGNIQNCKSVSNGSFVYEAINCADSSAAIAEATKLINSVGSNEGSPFKGSTLTDYIVDKSGGI